MNDRGPARSETTAAAEATEASATLAARQNQGPWAHPGWPSVAAALMLCGLALLLAGWFMPSLWRPGWAAMRPWAWLLVAAGALMNWLAARHRDRQMQREALGKLTHNSMTPYEFAPETLPMDESGPQGGSSGTETPVMASAAATAAPAADATSSAPAATPLPSTRATPTHSAPAVLPGESSAIAPLMAAVLASGQTTAAEPRPAAKKTARPPPAESKSGATTTAPAPAPEPPGFSAGLLRGLEWRRFEALCELMLQQDGYETRSEPHGSTTGADIRLHSRLDLQHAVRIVACRPWQAEAVPASALREFLGAMVDAGLTSGAFMTAGRFAADSTAFARRHGITLVDEADMLALIARRSPALQQALLHTATDGEPWRPTCRQCGAKMNPTTSPDGEPGHWQCAQAPTCRGRERWVPGPP